MHRTPVTAARPLRRLLVASDFSSGAAAPLSRVPYLALAPRAEITILHVLPAPLSSALRERELAEAERRLRWEAARLLRALRAAGRKQVRLRTAVAQGQPHLEILRRSGSMDLVVIGRHGRRPFPDLLVGSTAERVIRRAEVATLLVGRRARSAYRRPIAAVDLSEASRTTLDLVSQVAAPTHRVLDVVHVYETAHEQMLRRVGTSRSRAEYNRDCRFDARREVGTLIAASAAAPVVRAVVLRRSDPRLAILAAAQTRRADLIAVGTHGRTGLSHWLLGSVAEAVMRHASCDVLVAPHQRAAKRWARRAA
jgi:nucleotide-binding universal stress UspA family protein